MDMKLKFGFFIGLGFLGVFMYFPGNNYLAAVSNFILPVTPYSQEVT